MDGALPLVIAVLVIAALVALAGLGGKPDAPGKRQTSQNVVLGVAAVLILTGGLAFFLFGSGETPLFLSLISLGGGVIVILGAALICLLLYGILTLMERWANKPSDE